MSRILERWNALPEEEAIREMLAHCGSRTWATAMARARPIPDAGSLFETADVAWVRLSDADRREAFAAHPRIGDRAAAGQAAREQAGAAEASPETRDAFARANEEYERRFGRIFLVCATGKTAEQMLALCRQRLHNDPTTEFEVTSEEQIQITRLRLKRWLEATD